VGSLLLSVHDASFSDVCYRPPRLRRIRGCNRLRPLPALRRFRPQRQYQAYRTVRICGQRRRGGYGV